MADIGTSEQMPVKESPRERAEAFLNSFLNEVYVSTEQIVETKRSNKVGWSDKGLREEREKLLKDLRAKGLYQQGAREQEQEILLVVRKMVAINVYSNPWIDKPGPRIEFSVPEDKDVRAFHLLNDVYEKGGIEGNPQATLGNQNAEVSERVDGAINEAAKAYLVKEKAYSAPDEGISEATTANLPREVKEQTVAQVRQEAREEATAVLAKYFT